MLTALIAAGLTVVALAGYVAVIICMCRRRWLSFWVLGIVANASLAAARGLTGQWGWLAVAAAYGLTNCAGLIAERRKWGGAR